MRTYFALLAIASSALVAAPPQHIVSPEMKAKTIVQRAVKVLHHKGLEALTAEVKKPAGDFKINSPSPDPRLTVYSATFTVLAENPANPTVRVEESSLPKIAAFAKEKGPGWFKFEVKDASGNAKPYQSYVALHDDVLIAATIEGRR